MHFKTSWRRITKAALVGLLAFGAFSTTTAAASKKTVTDIAGTKVTMPKKITRVADMWHANNQVVLLLGGQKKLVATTPVIQKLAWYAKVDPAIKKVTSPFSGQDIQTEELLKTKPQVALTSDANQAKTLRDAGVPTANVMFQNFAGLKKSVKITANILGGNAPKVAKTYIKELNSNISYVKKQVKNDQTKPSILHIGNVSDLTNVDGRNTIIDDWMKAAGAKNALTAKGNQITVTAEQIAKSNPDMIIIGGTTSKKALATLKKDSRFKNLKAVKAGKVYGNPTGTFAWDRYSTEAALQVLWVAKLAHPNQFKSLNMVKKTQNFYNKYYNYDLTKTEAKQILAGENPA